MFIPDIVHWQQPCRSTLSIYRGSWPPMIAQGNLMDRLFDASKNFFYLFTWCTRDSDAGGHLAMARPPSQVQESFL